MIGFRWGKILPSSGWLPPCRLVVKKMGRSPKFGEKATVQSGNVPPYILVVEKKEMVKSCHVTCGVWSESGLSRSECQSVISV